eukprot:15798-Heterococcus_DN1.PRE.1
MLSKQRLQEVIGTLQSIVQRGAQAGHLLGRPLSAAHYSEVVGHCCSAIVIELPGCFIYYPAVHSSPARVDPQDVLEAKVLSQACVHDSAQRVRCSRSSSSSTVRDSTWYDCYYCRVCMLYAEMMTSCWEES